MKKLLVLAFLLAGLFSTAEAAPPGSPFIAIIEPAPYNFGETIHYAYGNLPNNVSDAPGCVNPVGCAYTETICTQDLIPSLPGLDSLVWWVTSPANGNVYVLGQGSANWNSSLSAFCRGILWTNKNNGTFVNFAEVEFWVTP